MLPVDMRRTYRYLYVCFSGFDNSMYVDLYDGDDNIATKMIDIGIAAKSPPPPNTVRLHQSVDDNVAISTTSTTEQLIVLVPG